MDIGKVELLVIVDMLQGLRKIDGAARAPGHVSQQFWPEHQDVVALQARNTLPHSTLTQSST